MPSINFTSLIISANRLYPYNRIQRFSASLHNLNTQAIMVSREKQFLDFLECNTTK